MKKQNKTNLRRLLGALTALLVVAGIAVGVYWVGSLRGWFAPPPVTVEKPTTDRQIIRLIARVMAGRISPSHFPFLHSQT